MSLVLSSEWGDLPLTGRSLIIRPQKVNIVETTSKQFWVSICRVLCVTQQSEGRTILVPEVILRDDRDFRPVVSVPILVTYLVLPMVVPPQGSCHHKALMHHQSPVALEGASAFQMVDIVGKHK